MGARPSANATLVERTAHCVRAEPLHEEYKADAVREVDTRDLRELRSGLRKSLTWDRGREMAEHQQLATELELDVFFSDLRSR